MSPREFVSRIIDLFDEPFDRLNSIMWTSATIEATPDRMLRTRISNMEATLKAYHRLGFTIVHAELKSYPDETAIAGSVCMAFGGKALMDSNPDPQWMETWHYRGDNDEHVVSNLTWLIMKTSDRLKVI